VRQLARLDMALLAIAVPLWAVCFALGVKTQVDGGGFLGGLGLSVESAQSHPTLTGEFSSLYPFDPLAKSGLTAGDRLVSVGGTELRGVGALGLRAIAREEAGRNLHAPVVYERNGERRETSVNLFPVSILRPWLTASFAFAASALYLLLRASPTPMVRAYFHAGLCFAFITCFFAGNELQFYAFVGLFLVSMSLILPLLFRFVFLFPDDRPPAGRWHRIWPWLFVAAGPFTAIAIAGPVAIGELGFNGTLGLGALLLLAVATGKYHRSDPVERRQIKWVLLGLYCFLLPLVVASAVAFLEPRPGWLLILSLWAAPLFPLFLLVGVARFNLFDIDRLLSATASYNIVAFLVVGGGFVAVPRLAKAASGPLGVDPGAGQIALSLLLAGFVVPVHRRLRPQIERLFFKERYALDHGIPALLEEVSSSRDVRELTERTGAGLRRLLRPEPCVVYARADGSYAPVFVEGRAVPPAFQAEGPLIACLQARRAPLALSGAGRRPDEAPLGPFDRAALETLQAEAVVPIRQGQALAAFLCLGPKRSGDVYTSTDLSHLAAVAKTASNQLLRFDQEEVTREAEAMRESLRRYVPGAVAEHLASGAELTPGERQVSVLFVDIRGYTTYSETRRAEEIFSTVNRYTEAVSQIVHRHGGSVVEFNGDGMMAVFGAPRDLAHKERAAVEAGREIVLAVRSILVEDSATEHGGLSVGVGIATGPVYVGNIQAVDRMIWSAIGSTTNLAARLQALTRDLDADLVTDAATRDALGAAGWGFERREDTPIRGWSHRQDVYVLPTARAS
jgi:class 3 adenylate cyclase